MLSLVLFVVGAQAEDSHDLPLKLFGKNVLQEFDGCSFSMWQQDRDPTTDKYAYVFFAPIHDGGEMPGWMKIGDNVYEMYRQDAGTAGTDTLVPFQLFRAYKDNYWAILEILEQHRSGHDIYIDRAELTVVGDNKFPFVIEVKGKNGCPAHLYEPVADEHGGESYLSLPGDEVSLVFASESNDVGESPLGMRQYTAQNYETCNVESTAGYSARYEITDSMSLWLIPCALYARDSTSNFFTVLNDNPEYFSPVYANHPPGLAGFQSGELKEVLNAQVYSDNGSIVSWESSAQGDCGAYWEYRLRAVEGEAVEAFLVEYRRKDTCDGVVVDPFNMPLIYKAD